MANPKSLARPPAGKRYDPTAIDATGATLGDVLTVTSDGTGGQIYTPQTPSGGGAPTGAAGGVLSGTYPNPGFAADMATQAELDAVAAAKASLTGATFSGDVNVPDEAYDATTWNGSTEVPTKNAIRDKIEALGAGYTDEQAQDAVGGILDDGGDIDFTYDDATPKITALVKAGVVTWAKIQNMTSGKLLGRSTAGSGSVEELTVGTGLTLAGGTLSASGGSSTGGLVLLESHTASASASLNFTTRNASGQSGATIQSDFDEYLIELIQLIPVTNNVDLYMRLSTNGGSTYVSTNTYALSGWRNSHAGQVATGNIPSAPNDKWILSSGDPLSNNANYGMCGTIRLFNPGGSIYKRIQGSTSWFTASGSQIVGLSIEAAFLDATAVNAFQILPSSGNFNGIIRTYGIAK